MTEGDPTRQNGQQEFSVQTRDVELSKKFDKDLEDTSKSDELRAQLLFAWLKEFTEVFLAAENLQSKLVAVFKERSKTISAIKRNINAAARNNTALQQLDSNLHDALFKDQFQYNQPASKPMKKLSDLF